MNKELQTEPATQPKAGRKEWIGLAVIALPCMLYSMDLTVLNLALPHLSADLNPGSAELLWIVDIYGFMVAGFLMTMGTLGDRIGRRKLLMIGAVAFGLASVLAAYSNTAGMLIAARALLGIAGATLAPSTLSLIRNMFHDPQQRTFAIGVWITSYSAGAAIGPLIGGSLLEYFWWGSVFLVSVPVMILLLVLAPSLLPEYKDPDAGRIDIVSALLSLIAVLSIIFGLKKIAENEMVTVATGIIIAGLVIGYVFIRRQKQLKHPLIDLGLFQRKSFNAALVIYTLGTFMAFGTFVFTFQYLQLVLGLKPLQAGLWSLPFFIAFIIGSMLSPMLVRKWRATTVLAGGLFLATIGFAMITQISIQSGPLYLVIASFIYCLGLAPVFTLTTDIVVGSAPPEKAGAASAISETGSELGGALGIAILGSIGTLIYRNQLDNSLPASLPGNTVSVAKETLAAAVSESERLAGEQGAVLYNAAGEAFVSSFHAVAMAGVIISMVTGLLCAIKLKQVQ
jgi:DHA2 family multidrug resistance protein-like MFS transporter